MQPGQPNRPVQPTQPQNTQSDAAFTQAGSTISDINPAKPALNQNVYSATTNNVTQQDSATLVQLNEAQEENLEYDGNSVSWKANEFIHQERGTMWFVAFGVTAVVLLGIAIYMQWWSFAVLLVVIAIVIAVYTRRPPRELTYVLSDDGLEVDGKLYEFESFKAFGIIKDREEYSVMLIPIQRFQPGLMVYFPEHSGEDIVDMLGSRLPMKDLKLDAVDRVVRLLRL